MHQNNVFTVAKRNLEGQDMIYQAIKFTNNVWALTELKIQPGNPNITVSWKSVSCSHRACTDQPLHCSLQLALKSRAMDVAQGIYQAYETVLKN